MTLKTLRQILKALSDDTRLRIINLLSKKELTVTDICKTLKASQSSVSKHLVRLRLLKMVKDRRDGVYVIYSLNRDSEQGQAVKAILSDFSEIKVFQKDHQFIEFKL